MRLAVPQLSLPSFVESSPTPRGTDRGLTTSGTAYTTCRSEHASPDSNDDHGTCACSQTAAGRVLIVVSRRRARAQEGCRTRVDAWVSPESRVHPTARCSFAEKRTAAISESFATADLDALRRSIVQVTVNETGLLGVAVDLRSPMSRGSTLLHGPTREPPCAELADGLPRTDSRLCSICCRPPPAVTNAAISRWDPTASSTSSVGGRDTGAAPRLRTCSADASPLNPARSPGNPWYRHATSRAGSVTRSACASPRDG